MIDELETVRRIGAEETAPDREARERVRARVLSAGAAAPRRSPWRRLLGVARPAPAFALALAVVVAGVALAVVLRPGGDAREFSGERPAPATSGGAPELFPAPDEFLYLRSRTRNLVCSPDSCVMQPERTREIWLSATRPSTLIDKAGSQPLPENLGPVPPSIGNRTFTHAELAAYEPTPRSLLRELIEGRPPGQGDGGASYPFRQITDALSESAMPLRVRRALVGALALVPGVTERGPATDDAGRDGIAFSREVEGQREEIIVDPETLTMLEQRTVVVDPSTIRGLDAKPGEVIGRATYLERAVVPRAGERP
jgi:hypothetical protein